MANTWNISFDATGVKPATDTNGMPPPEGIYRAKVSSIDTTAAKGEGREGEYNSELTISLTDVDYERKIWVSEPVCRNKKASDKAKKAAASGQRTWVAFMISRGIPADDVTGEINLSSDLVLDKEVFVKVTHKPSDKLKDDGTPFINAEFLFVSPDTFAEANAPEAVAVAPSANGKATATAKPAKGGGLAALLAR